MIIVIFWLCGVWVVGPEIFYLRCGTQALLVEAGRLLVAACGM